MKCKRCENPPPALAKRNTHYNKSGIHAYCPGCGARCVDGVGQHWFGGSFRVKVAVNAAQGDGKSTLLRDLEAAGWKVSPEMETGEIVTVTASKRRLPFVST